MTSFTNLLSILFIVLSFFQLSFSNSINNNIESKNGAVESKFDISSSSELLNSNKNDDFEIDQDGSGKIDNDFETRQDGRGRYREPRRYHDGPRRRCHDEPRRYDEPRRERGGRNSNDNQMINNDLNDNFKINDATNTISADSSLLNENINSNSNNDLNDFEIQQDWGDRWNWRCMRRCGWYNPWWFCRRRCGGW